MNATLCVDCRQPACDCTPLAKASNYTVVVLASDAYMRAGGDSVFAVLSLQETATPIPGVDTADLIDRARAWLVDGMGDAERQMLEALTAQRATCLAIAEARYRRAVANHEVKMSVESGDSTREAA